MLAELNLDGRVALITGASSGIGRRLALLFAANGANVVAVARREAALAELTEEAKANGGQVLGIQGDITNEESLIAAYDMAESKFGPIDTVVGNAGTSASGSALGMPVDKFDGMVAVNLRGAFLTAREGARRMIAAGSPSTGQGRILMISSITGTWVPSGSAGYAATKAAVNQLTRGLAKDWAGKGINVNALAPGYIETELTEPMWQTDYGKALVNGFPRKRIMPASALDHMAVFLCSDASACVTGSIFTIDDGQTLGSGPINLLAETGPD